MVNFIAGVAPWIPISCWQKIIHPIKLWKSIMFLTNHNLKPQREIFRKKFMTVLLMKNGNPKLNLSPQVASSSGFWILLEPSFCSNNLQQYNFKYLRNIYKYIPNLLTSKSLEKLPLKLSGIQFGKSKPPNAPPQNQQSTIIYYFKFQPLTMWIGTYEQNCCQNSCQNSRK